MCFILSAVFLASWTPLLVLYRATGYSLNEPQESAIDSISIEAKNASGCCLLLRDHLPHIRTYGDQFHEL